MDKVLHDPAQLHFTDHGFSVKMPYSRSEDNAFDILATMPSMINNKLSHATLMLLFLLVPQEHSLYLLPK